MKIAWRMNLSPFLIVMTGIVINESAWSQEQVTSLAEQKTKIISALQSVKLEPFPATGSIAECASFLDDFKSQVGIEHLRPSVKASRPSDLALRGRVEKCPSLNLSMNVYFRAKYSSQIIPEQNSSEICRFGSCDESVDGTNDFRVYEVDFDNDSENGTETIYYEGGLKGRKEYFGGMYKLLDLENCKIVSHLQVPNGGSATTPLFSDHGLVRYKGRVYLFDLVSHQFPNRRLPLTSLRLYKHQYERRSDASLAVIFSPVCTYGPPVKGGF